MLKKIKNKKGQIGEILVVVILIILAVLGVMKYVMPMFNKSDKLSSQSSGQVDAVSNSTKVENGQPVSGAEIQGIWGAMCSQTNVGKLQVTGMLNAIDAEASASYSTEVGKFVDTAVNYTAAVTFHDNGEIKTISLTK